MMADFEIVAEPRTETGKGAMRRLRRSGMIPAVVYGTDKAPQTVQIAENYLRKQLENEAVYSHILTLKVGGSSEQAVIKDLQRHPSTSRVTHLDFLRVSATQAITIQVPLNFLNEDTAPGARQGGNVTHLMNEVEISCLPKDLPESIDVDVGHLEIGDSVMLSQLVLPEGVELTASVDHDHDQPVVSVQMMRGAAAADEEDGEGDAETPDADAPAADDDAEE
ncbi:MAG: 50S ribosomal protein L25/general stress protein Ctc [Pseudomonadota bacterium]